MKTWLPGTLTMALCLAPHCLADHPGARSIYQLAATWTEDSGQELQLRELAGDVQVLAFFYTSCESACPMTVKALQSVSREPGSPRAGFLLVSVDPAQDSLAALRRYRRTMKLGDRWKLLRGPPAEVRKLAALLGFNYEEVDSGRFVHTNLVTVLNTRGEVVHQQSALDGNLAALAAAIRAAHADRCLSPPSSAPGHATTRSPRC